MNPLDWDHGTVRSFQTSLSTNHQNDVINSMETASITNEEWHTFCKYARSAADEAQSSMGWKEPSLPLHNVYMKDSEVEDADGEALEMDEEDPELARKRKELREIEERILLKKAAIALKSVEPLVTMTSPDLSCNESAACIGATLKDRVNLILQQQHPASFLSKVRSPKDRMNSSSLSKDGLLQDDHPLKLRVKALMNRRCSDPFVLPASVEVPDLTPPPSSRSVTSPDNENGVNEGFQRFLSVLNKGVDMDFLSRIVNDDSVDLPLGEELINIQVPAVENESDPTFRRESQQSDGGASLPGSSRTDSGERKCDPPSQERSLSERLSLPNDDEKKNDRSRSKSPSAVKKKKRKEEENPKVDEQREQLQNILKSLGLSLEVEEMSKLADRTQERLYGKKHEDTRVEQESQQRASQRHYSNSSSSSSSSSSSRSNNPSPSRRRRSHSREPRRRSERSRSRDRRGDGLTRRDGNEDSKEERRYRDENEKYPKEISSYQHPYQQNHTYTQPAALSAFPDSSFSQDSQYTAYHSGTYSAASNSYWAPTQGAIPPFFYTRGCPYPQNTYEHFPDSVVAPDLDYPHQHDSIDINLFVNPDLSKSEGQTGSVSGSRCLQVISTKQPTANRCLQRRKKAHKRKGKLETRIKKRRLHWAKFRAERKQRKVAEKQMVEKVEAVEAPQLKEDDTKAEQAEEKRPPTEEEIKANLRKKLEAFNQKMKQKVTQPANSLTSPTG